MVGAQPRGRRSRIDWHTHPFARNDPAGFFLSAYAKPAFSWVLVLSSAASMFAIANPAPRLSPVGRGLMNAPKTGGDCAFVIL